MSDPNAHVSHIVVRTDQVNPWRTALWTIAIAFIALGAVLVVGASDTTDLKAAVALSAIGSAMLLSGFVGIVLAVVVGALQWKPSDA